jgi:hypothetical protein
MKDDSYQDGECRYDDLPCNVSKIHYDTFLKFFL